MAYSSETKSEKFDRAIGFIIILGVCLNYWGTVSNMIVLHANNQTMPVILESNTTLIQGEGRFKHSAESGNMMLLSDWIYIDFPYIEDSIPAGTYGDAIRQWVKYLNYPVEGGVSIVSIGDLMRWIGSVQFIIFTPILLLLIPRRGYLILRERLN